MKIWITKYALTQGIKEVDSEKMSRFEADETTLLFNENPSSLLEIYSGKDWHRTKESAIKRAEEMRDKKIENLKKQLGKLEKMRFE